MSQFIDFRFTVTNNPGHRLDQILAECTDLSRRKVRRAIDNGGVYVDRKRCRKAGLICKTGAKLRLVMLENERLEPLTVEQIIWQKDSLALIHKRAGQYAQEALHRSNGTIPTELGGLLELPHTQAKQVRPVHRLDRGTSGLMLLSWQARLLNHLQECWADSIDKEYLAVVSPVPEWRQRRIQLPIGKVRDAAGRYAVDQENGRACDTEAEVLETRQNRALLKLVPHTGRTHQLRIHLAHIGHPILGDNRYGGAAHVRMMLHAHRLCLHPPALPTKMDWIVNPDEEDWKW